MYKLRPYQADAVRSVIHYFRQHDDPAVIVLPTGAGKSLVIAELARLAKGRVLVLAHVKELVEQNHQKYEGYGLTGSVFSAGLGRKETGEQVIFASVQSVVRHLAQFTNEFSLLIIDECHRVPDKKDSSYQKVISHLREKNPNLKVLGLTATPYRLGLGWIYQYHTRGQVRSTTPRFFRDCIFELPIHFLLDENFLTPANIVDAPVLSYDFSQIHPMPTGSYKASDLDMVISDAQRVTPQIIHQIVGQSEEKQGVMIFAATVRHAQEIHALLPSSSAIITGETPQAERDDIIQRFKQKQLKYLVNVSVLTTGFDAPHVDLIAILRPTESVSLYQQIVGRGLRLAPGKQECLVLDYAGNRYDLEQPEVGEAKPSQDCEIVTIPCPACGFNNNFWGKLDSQGILIEHYGRRCQGYFTDEETHEREICGYRFRAKYCHECGADNDIAARICHECQATLVDPDKKLKEALNLKDALVFECHHMEMMIHKDSQNRSQIKVTYQGDKQAQVHEFWSVITKKQKSVFHQRFVRPHLADKHRPFHEQSAQKIVASQHRFRFPLFVIACKTGRFWKIRDKIFADELTQLPEDIALKHRE
ncbi:type I restriction enzyme EcoKI subunit R [Vibrio aerogenes CECT 7868]|uniref:Type I restriction enzyme EcoKI subunit R n=1 Tax=Vibrio aerogenes CECT 7868 TaxID=1216006 RepID=A0A1M6DWR2_9VIBR|nr:DEAD/DEAH box helicase [Vibrio aerogenes]SHI77583.1 type I restriction enzyme EcoKI subunit R [Vibrio aerogenes CECT 7868]